MTNLRIMMIIAALITSVTSAVDNHVNDFDAPKMSLHDTTPPILTALFIPIGKIKNNCGIFRIEFKATDDSESKPRTEASINGVSVKNWQIVWLQLSDRAKINRAYGFLKLAAPVFNLVVAGTDNAGNSSRISTQYVF